MRLCDPFEAIRIFACLIKCPDLTAVDDSEVPCNPKM